MNGRLVKKTKKFVIDEIRNINNNIIEVIQKTMEMMSQFGIVQIHNYERETIYIETDILCCN